MCSFNLFLILSAIFVIVFGENSSARNFYSDCGQVFTKKQFIIESLRYPSNYPLNYECSYLIKGPTCPTRFNLQLIDFNVEDSLGCSKDRLEVDDKDALCGSKNNEVKEYFSEKGTLILKFVSDDNITGRGYRILVMRSSCETQNSAPETTTYKVPNWYTTNNEVEYTPTTKPTVYVNKNKGKCCQTDYSSKQFILTSPNFPYSMSTPAECVYEIHKTHLNICRLRIHVQFFWLGRKGNSCFEGFLEIDGKHFCGCKSDLKIIAPFQDQSTKILRFVSKGYEQSSYSGFVMEIIQDECPKKVVPKIERNVTYEKSFKFYNDQINRIAWPNKSHEAAIEKLHLISENTEVLTDESDNFNGKSRPQVIRHVYFYAYPDRTPKDREETEYVDTSSVNTSFIKDIVDYNYCRNWNQMQFNNFPLRNLPVCKSSEGSVAAKKCIELNQVRGYFKSPGYPFYYPGNVNVCYRFHKLPGHCTIRIYMKDFNLQNGVTCENDYLLFVNKLRYCGHSLSNTISTLDLRNKPYEEMNFITDALYCNRGFFGSYEQLPCEESSHPINPTPSPATPCSRTFQDREFTLDVYDYNEPMCTFTIKKYSEYVCSVRLYFEEFNLMCASESLVIDGTMYCGRLTGQNVEVDITNKDSLIIYRRSSSVGINGLRLRIRGEQLSDSCQEPEVPAERFLSLDSLNDTFENNTQFVFKMGTHFKDICGVITNTTEIDLPNTFCDFIMKNRNNVTKCLPLKENSLFIPSGSQKLELKIRDVEKTEEIEFKEVDCDEMMKKL